MRLRNRVGLAVRVWTVAALTGALMLLAGPAGAEHDPDGDGQYCVDSSTAHADEPLFTDTGVADLCVVAGGTAEFEGRVGGAGGGGAGGAVGAVPTRIDAGAGGAAIGGNPASLGVVLLGATSAAAAVVSYGAMFVVRKGEMPCRGRRRLSGGC